VDSCTISAHKDAWSLKPSTSGLSRSTLPMRAGLDNIAAGVPGIDTSTGNQADLSALEAGFDGRLAAWSESQSARSGGVAAFGLSVLASPLAVPGT
jgi:hypothetical protein